MGPRICCSNSVIRQELWGLKSISHGSELLWIQGEHNVASWGKNVIVMQVSSTKNAM